MLRELCSHVDRRVLMDADVSADAAVEAGLKCIAPRLPVLHVQLQQAALKRVFVLCFTGPKGATGYARWKAKLDLWLERALWVDDEWVAMRKAKRDKAFLELCTLRLVHACRVESGRKERPEDAEERVAKEVVLFDRACAKDKLRACMASWMLYRRESEEEAEEGTEENGSVASLGKAIDRYAQDVSRRARCDEGKRPSPKTPKPPRPPLTETERTRLRQRLRAAIYDRRRVLISCATPGEAKRAAEMCDAIGVRALTPYRSRGSR
eukprot:5824884-Prymnesium_polylepis.1